ncbi:MAG TPA: SCP2 sterol-binding domain-containing protein [Myxococcota bacterium]|nr:SCP2 sterol-binding domain-containing protein [Myxococcota bacterium]
MSERARPPADIAPAEFFRCWAPDAVRTDPERRKKLENLRARIQFDLAGEGGGLYWLEIGDGEVSGGEGPLAAPDLVLSTDVETWRKLNAGEVKAPTAVMKGKLRFQGSMYLALRIHFIIG